MSEAEDVIRRVVRGEAEPGGFHWGRLTHAMHEIASAPPPPPAARADMERLLHDLLELEGPVPIREDSSLPHVMAPEHMLRAFAMQVLAQWDLEKHRDRIEAVAGSDRTPKALAAVARGLLTEG